MHASYSLPITQRNRLPPPAMIMHALRHTQCIIYTLAHPLRSTAASGARPTLPPATYRCLNRHGSPCLALLCQLSIKLTQRCSILLHALPHLSLSHAPALSVLAIVHIFSQLSLFFDLSTLLSTLPCTALCIFLQRISLYSSDLALCIHFRSAKVLKLKCVQKKA